MKKFNVKIYIDGSKTPVETKCAYYLIWNKKIKQKIIILSNDMTSNQAEYYGLLHALDQFFYPEKTKIKIYSDSLLLVNQIKGIWKIKSENLKELKMKVLDKLDKFLGWDLIWIPREKNKAGNLL